MLASTPEAFDEYGGDELEELGIFGDGDDVFDDLMPDEFAVDVRSVTTVNCNFPRHAHSTLVLVLQRLKRLRNLDLTNLQNRRTVHGT